MLHPPFFIWRSDEMNPLSLFQRRDPGVAAIGMALAASLAAQVIASPGAAQPTCAHFAEVKVAIDNVIDKDANLGADFRRKFKEGEDSIFILEGILEAAIVKKMDICRYDVAEYLTKRGFPPPH